MNGVVRTILLAMSLILTASCSVGNEDKMIFSEKINNLINASSESEEEIALGELLVNARETNINYGYRVFNVSKNKRVMPGEINEALDDDLRVTIFVGEDPPYDEYEWRPKYNGHITRLVMP